MGDHKAFGNHSTQALLKEGGRVMGGSLNKKKLTIHFIRAALSVTRNKWAV